MQATFKISAEELDERLINQIKKMFEGKPVTITITTQEDDTIYLNADPANKKHLEESMASVPEIVYTAEEFEKHVDKLLKKNQGIIQPVVMKNIALAL